MIDKNLKKRLKELESEIGYLNVELYDKYRGVEYPSSETIKKNYKVSLVEVLKNLEIRTRDEYLVIKNKPIAISNMKLLYLEHGEISKSLYSTSKLLPSCEYITKHYGWEQLAKEANVKLANAQYVTDEDVLKELKNTIKKMGYVPTGEEYSNLKNKPTQEILRKHGYTFVEAMRKCGYRPYNKPVKIKDKVCISKDCFRQFTPVDNELYCDQCYKEIRSRLIKEIDNMGPQKLKDVCKKLIYSGNKQNTILDIFNNM